MYGKKKHDKLSLSGVCTYKQAAKQKHTVRVVSGVVKYVIYKYSWQAIKTALRDNLYHSRKFSWNALFSMVLERSWLVLGTAKILNSKFLKLDELSAIKILIEILVSWKIMIQEKI